MSSSEAINSAPGKPSILSTIEHEGNLIEHISCPNAEVLLEHVQKCNRENRTIMPGHPVKLPKNPSKRIDYFLNIDAANAILEHCRPDQVISVEAGISIASLNKTLKDHKQWFPVYVPDESISLMEYINSGSSGPLEHGYGEARDLVLGMQVVLGSGQMIKCGGKVVKNVTGYDLPKLFAGAHGTMCIPFSAHLRLYALPETSRSILLRCNSTNEGFQIVRQLSRSGLPVSCLEIVDSDIFAFAPDKTSNTLQENLRQSKVIVCAQIHGDDTVVSALEKEIVRICSKAISKEDILDADDERNLWSFLSKPAQFSSGTKWIEIAAANKDLEKLLSELKSKHSSLAWTARPSRNKATVMVKDNIDLQEIIDAMKDASKKESSQITAAFANDNYLWKTAALPEEDPVLSELKYRLRREYDPQGILNPLSLL